MLIDCIGNEMPVFTQWLALAKIAAGDDWAEYNEAYSFEAAFEDGMTASEAVKDCKDWLEA